jgi:hypothetical protein
MGPNRNVGKDVYDAAKSSFWLSLANESNQNICLRHVNITRRDALAHEHQCFPCQNPFLLIHADIES